MSENVSTNITSSQLRQTMTIPSLVALVLMLLAILGNLMVIFAVIRYRALRSIPNLVISNLSVTDVLFPTTVVLWNTIYRSLKLQIPKSVRCNISGFQTYFFFLASIYSLTFVSVERYLATNYPLRHKRFFNESVAKKVLAGIWLWSAFCGSTVFGASKYAYIEEMSHCTLDWLGQSATISIAYFLISFFFPFVVVVYCNVLILKAARRSENIRAASSSSTNSYEKSRMRREHRISSLIAMVIVAFILCWTPYITCICLLRADFTIPQFIVSISMLIAVCSSCVNPYIYAFMNKKFRAAFVGILCCKKSREI